MRQALLAAVITLAANNAFAVDENESATLALNLASVLAYEEPCQLSYDQPAIEAYIDAKVPDDDMGFSSSLRLFMGTVKADIEEMSASEKTAQCAQAKRVAKKYGFIK